MLVHVRNITLLVLNLQTLVLFIMAHLMSARIRRVVCSIQVYRANNSEISSRQTVSIYQSYDNLQIDFWVFIYLSIYLLIYLIRKNEKEIRKIIFLFFSYFHIYAISIYVFLCLRWTAVGEYV